MKKTNKAKQAQKPQGRVPKQPKGVTELTDQALEQVQGGLTPGVYVVPPVRSDGTSNT